jgi:hypothetical protein
MSDIGNIIETLAQAKTALEENPNLKTEIESLKAQLNSMAQAHADLQDKHVALYNDHDEACIKVTELEASLEAARFQELAANKKLNKLAEIVGEALHEALPPVEPVVEPEPVLVDQSANLGVIIPPELAEPTVTIANPDGRDWQGSPKDSTEGETAEQLHEAIHEPDAEPTTWVQAQDKPHGWLEPKVEPTVNPTSETTSGVEPSPEPILSSGGSEVTPFVTNPIAEPKPESIQSLPNYGKPYSFKPNSCTWREWIEGGGQRPWWLTEDVLGQMDQAPQSAAS